MSDHKELLKERMQYIRENLPFGMVFHHYNLPWTTDKTHQVSCPFHGEDRNPSARYYADSKRFQCFACTEDQGGDVVWFIKKMQHLESYDETFIFITKTFGVSLDDCDLSKRIALKDQIKSFPPRQIFAKSFKDRINDVIYRLKQDYRVLPGDIMRVENFIWESWTGIEEAATPEYLVYCDSVRMWYQTCVDMIRQFLISKGLMKLKDERSS